MSTIAEEAFAGRGQHENRDGGHCRTVDVHVNNHKVVLQPGSYDVPTFKKVAGVPQADDLDELVNHRAIGGPRHRGSDFVLGFEDST